MRRPRQVPLSRLNGATPTRLAILRRSRAPSSGSSAIRVRADGRCRCPGPRRAGPRSRARRGLARTAWSSSPSISSQRRLQPGEVGVERSDLRRGREAGGGGSLSCRSSRRAGGGGRPAHRGRAPPRPRSAAARAAPSSAKSAITSASSRSVLASRPVARAKSRTWRGLTTASGQLCGGERGRDGHLEAAGGLEHDQRRSEARPGARPERSRPAASRPTANASPDGRTCTSSRSLATSIPTKARQSDAP